MSSKPSLIRLRVWADKADIHRITQQFIQHLTPVLGEPVKVSDIYPCRAPKQYQGSVYLTYVNTFAEAHDMKTSG